MRIFKGNVGSLAFLSCCSQVDDPHSPKNAVTPHHDYQTSTLTSPTNLSNKIRQVPSIECLQRTFSSKSRGRERMTCHTNPPSRSSSHCSHLRRMDSNCLHKSYNIPPTPKIPNLHPLNIDNTLIPSIPAPSTANTTCPATSIASSPTKPAEFKPLDLRISLTSNEWTSSTPFTINDNNDQKQMHPSDPSMSQPEANKNSHPSTEPSSERNKMTEKCFGVSDDRSLCHNSEYSQDPNRESNHLSHSKNNSDSAILERLKLALAEKSMLTERLKNVENDIVRKSIYFGDISSSHSIGNNRSFTDELEFFSNHPTQSNYSLPTVLHPRSYSLNSSSIRPNWGEDQPPVPDIRNTFAHKREKSKSNHQLQSRHSVSSVRPYGRRDLSSASTLPDQGNLKSPQQGILKISAEKNYKLPLPHPLQSSPPNSSTQSIVNSEYCTPNSLSQERENIRPPLQSILKSSSYRTDNYTFNNSLKSSPAYIPARRNEENRPATSGCLLPDHDKFIPPLPFILNNPAHEEDKVMSRVSSWLTVTSNHNNQTNPNFHSNEFSPASHSEEFYQFAKPTHSSTESSISVKDDFISTPGGDSPIVQSGVYTYDETEYYQISLPNIDLTTNPPVLGLNERANKKYFSQNQYSGIAF